MNRDDILRMARNAKLPMAWIKESGVLTWSELERFAALVAAEEREACAKVCDHVTWSDEGKYFANHIRARSKTQQKAK
jgi:hypothetical protein